MRRILLGLQYLFSAMSRRVANRHRTVLEAFTFLFHYTTLRKEQWSATCLAWMETKYNIARAFHFLGRQGDGWMNKLVDKY